LRALFRNGEDTKQVFLIADTLRGRTGLTAFARFRKTALGQDWAALLPQDLDRVRRTLAVVEPTIYQGIIEAFRNGKAKLPLAAPKAMAVE
jgi:hypothetical protein